jgi:hypothetical protein
MYRYTYKGKSLGLKNCLPISFRAAGMAELHDSILEWPKGYNTQVRVQF